MSDSGVLRGKIALVTGASSGLGDRFARVLAKAGARLVLAARRLDLLEALQADIQRDGGIADVVVMDLADCASINNAIAEIAEKIGIVDILINNAGFANIGKIVDVSQEDYDSVMNVNVRGSFFVAKGIAKQMIECAKTDSDRQFRIVNIASVCGLRAVELPAVAVYGISKAAVVHMTKYMASEWRDYNINVNAIAPGNIATPANDPFFATEEGKELLDKLPRKRLGQPDDLDELVLMLSSDRSRFINGAIIAADDGLMAL